MGQTLTTRSIFIFQPFSSIGSQATARAAIGDWRARPPAAERRTIGEPAACFGISSSSTKQVGYLPLAHANPFCGQLLFHLTQQAL